MGIEICGPSGKAGNNRPMFINDGGSSSASVRPAGKTSGIFGASYSAVISTEQSVPFNFLIGTYTTGTRTKTVVNETGDSSRPISVYLEHDLGNVLDSTVGLKFNTNILTIDLRLGLGDTGIYGLVNNSSDTASEFGVKIDLPHLLAGIDSSSINYLDTGEWSQYTNLSIGGPFLTILLLIMGASQSSTSPSPSY